MEEKQENKTLAEKIKEREEKEKLVKRKVMKKIFLIVLIFLVIDQITKFAFVNKDISIIPGVLKFHTVQNRGGAFGVAQNSTFSFIVANIIVLGIIIKFISIQANQIDKKTGFALAMVLSGGFGNLIDRIFRSLRVVDWISTNNYGWFGMERFPTYNIADASVVISVIILAIAVIVDDRRKKHIEQER